MDIFLYNLYFLLGYDIIGVHLQPIVVGTLVKGYLANSADPDQTLQNAAANQGVHCLHIV